MSNINELKSLIKFGSISEAFSWLNTQGFINVSGYGLYFSSTTLIGSWPWGSTNCAWMLLMNLGADPYLKTITARVWAVRGGQ